MTPLDAPTTDVCQCTKAKGAEENEGDLGTTVICPDCHLEETNTREPNDAEQPVVEQAALPDERDVYIAFKGSTSLLIIATQHPRDQSIIKAIRKRQKSQQPVRNLVKEYGIATVVASLRALLDEEVFTSTDAARRRFPDLFPEEQVPRSEEGQGTTAERPSTKESQPGDSECNPPKDTAGGSYTGELQGSRHGQTLQDRRLLTSLPIRARQRLMSQLQLILEHACFAFGQQKMQKDLDDWGWSCAEAVPLQTWIDLFKQNETFETEGNSESLSDLLSSVARIQDIAMHRLSVDFVEVNELLSSAEEFVRLLDTPMYRDAVKPLREHIEGVLFTVNRNAASAQKEADKKSAEIRAQRERLKRQEEEAERYLKGNLDNLRDSIERDIFTAMRRAKDALPDIGLADQYGEHRY